MPAFAHAATASTGQVFILQVLMLRVETQAALCKISIKTKIKAVLGHPLSYLVGSGSLYQPTLLGFAYWWALAYKFWCAFGCSLTRSHPGDKI